MPRNYFNPETGTTTQIYDDSEILANYQKGRADAQNDHTKGAHFSEADLEKAFNSGLNSMNMALSNAVLAAYENGLSSGEPVGRVATRENLLLSNAKEIEAAELRGYQEFIPPNDIIELNRTHKLKMDALHNEFTSDRKAFRNNAIQSYLSKPWNRHFTVLKHPYSPFFFLLALSTTGLALLFIKNNQDQKAHGETTEQYFMRYATQRYCTKLDSLTTYHNDGITNLKTNCAEMRQSYQLMKNTMAVRRKLQVGDQKHYGSNIPMTRELVSSIKKVCDNLSLHGFYQAKGVEQDPALQTSTVKSFEKTS